MACPRLLRVSHGYRVIRPGACIPLDFISCVQTWISSWISSGSTSLRDQDSSQRGFGFATGSSLWAALEADRAPSLDLKTFLKNGMVVWRGEPQYVPGCIRHGRQIRGRGCGVLVWTRADVTVGATAQLPGEKWCK
jgi:hypothetical protein